MSEISSKWKRNKIQNNKSKINTEQKENEVGLSVLTPWRRTGNAVRDIWHKLDDPDD